MGTTASSVRVLWVGGGADRKAVLDGADGFAVEWCPSPADAAAQLTEGEFDAIVLDAAGPPEPLLSQRAWADAMRERPLLLLADSTDSGVATILLERGVQDVLARDEVASQLARRVRFAVARKHVERDARGGWSADPDGSIAGPRRLVEQLSQLLALRERDPAPMAVLAVVAGGLPAVAQAYGDAAAQALRRKAVLRLRGAVRASDIVAALDADTFVVLLARIASPDDAHAVAGKLEQALRQPFCVPTAAARMTPDVGVALYPRDGNDAESLLRCAVDAIKHASHAGPRSGAATDLPS